MRHSSRLQGKGVDVLGEIDWLRSSFTGFHSTQRISPSVDLHESFAQLLVPGVCNQSSPPVDGLHIAPSMDLASCQDRCTFKLERDRLPSKPDPDWQASEFAGCGAVSGRPWEMQQAHLQVQQVRAAPAAMQSSRVRPVGCEATTSGCPPHHATPWRDTQPKAGRTKWFMVLL